MVNFYELRQYSNYYVVKEPDTSAELLCFNAIKFLGVLSKECKRQTLRIISPLCCGKVELMLPPVQEFPKSRE